MLEGGGVATGVDLAALMRASSFIAGEWGRKQRARATQAKIGYS